EKLADLEKSLGQLEQARARYALRLEISERLAKANPHSEQLQRDYAVSVYKFAQILTHFGEFDLAGMDWVIVAARAAPALPLVAVYWWPWAALVFGLRLAWVLPRLRTAVQKQR
ncbi:MAG: hypothetical protein HC788_10145, partial [Sphingopyxis sp.]|nr:hypothetical protein [Sphingopyxis sp.]